MATKRPNDSDDHVGGMDGCGKTYTKRQKTLDECDFKKRDIPKIQGDKEITPKEENMHVGEVTKGDNFQNHNINSEKDQSRSVDYDSHRSRSTGEKSRHSGEHKKHTKDKAKDSKSSSRRESTDEESRYLHKHESRSKREDPKSSNRRKLTDEKPVHSNTYESEQRSRKHESDPSQKVEISPMKNKGYFKEEKSLDNSCHREEKKKKLDHLKFEHTEDLNDSHRNESPKDKSKHSDKYSQRTKGEDSGSRHRRESPDKKSSHSHKNENKPTPKHCDTTKDDSEEWKPTPKHCDTTKDDFEFFFGMKSPFSQFHPATFVVGDVTYNCAEQFMMHQKAVMFNDRQIAQQILSEPKPLKQKRLGRKVRGFDPHVWGSRCVDIVKEGNIAKFTQNVHLEKQLIATHPRIMAECSPRDCLWGIGLGANNEKALNVKTWRGKNLLGYALMEVRKHIMKAKRLIK